MKRLTLFAALVLVVACAAMAHASTKKMTKEEANASCSCFGWPAVDVDGDNVLDRYDNCVSTPKGCVVDEWGCSVDSDGDGVCDGVDQCPDTPKGVKVDKQGCSAEQKMARATPPPPPAPAPTPVAPEPPPPPPAPPVQTPTEQALFSGNLVLRDVYFETNSAQLKPESETRLDEVGAALEKLSGVAYEIQGHSDSRGTAAYNLKLSQARAESVRKYLVDHFKVSPGDLTAKGYGESQLAVSPEKGAEDWAKNRRVVLKVVNPDALPKGMQVEHQ